MSVSESVSVRLRASVREIEFESVRVGVRVRD